MRIFLSCLCRLASPQLLLVFLSAGLLLIPPAAWAEPLTELIPELLDTHQRIKAAEADFEASRLDIRQSQAAYLPSLDVTGDYGHERQVKPEASGTSTGFQEYDIKATQLIWDFGKTFSEIDRAKVIAEQAKTRLASVKQSLMREGVSAYLNLIRAVETLGYARQSEKSIKDLTGLEEARVDRGSGLATDVLQAKSQLAGAQAIRIQAEGALANAIHRFTAVFGRGIGDLKTYKRPRLPLDRLPESMDAAVEIALDNNLDLRVARIEVEIAKQTVLANESQLYYPRLEGVAEWDYKRNVQGTLDTKIEKTLKVELTYPLYAGGGLLAAYDSSLKTQLAADFRQQDLRRSVEEQVRNAWQNLQTFRANAGFLRNQADIAWEFLVLARKERQLGTRSLIDLLAGETNYITSISAAVSAETDMALALYDLLFVMSSLDLDAFRTADESPPAAPQP